MSGTAVKPDYGIEHWKVSTSLSPWAYVVAIVMVVVFVIKKVHEA